MKSGIWVIVLALAGAGAARADSIQGRWKLVAAVGSIVVAGGSCSVQIMSSDVPSFAATTAGVNGGDNAPLSRRLTLERAQP